MIIFTNYSSFDDIVEKQNKNKRSSIKKVKTTKIPVFLIVNETSLDSPN